MNSAAENINPPEFKTPEDLIKALEPANTLHSVFGQFGKAVGTFYNVPDGVVIDGIRLIAGRLAMPLQDNNGAIISIAYQAAERTERTIFDPLLKGCVIFGKPDKDKPLFVVSSIEAAFAISLTGNACLLTFTDTNTAYVINEWSAAGFARIYAPVGCDSASTTQIRLKGLDVQVLAMETAISQYIETPVLRAELAELVATAKDNTDGWGEPMPLREEQDAPPAYPVEAFPKLAQDAIKAIAYHVQAPIGLAGQCVLGTLGYIAQIHVNAPAMHNPEGMPCSLFILTEGASGDRKTGCHNLADKVIKDREKARVKEYQTRLNELNEGLDACKGNKAKDEYRVNNPMQRNPKTIFSNATIEPIAAAFIEGAIKNGAWSSDEGGQFFSGSTMKGDTANAALGALTKVFDSGIMERTRSKSNLDASGSAYDCRLMVNLLGQREVLYSALTDPILRGQGFLPRFMFSAPQSLAGTRLLTSDSMAQKSYNDPRLQRFWEQCGNFLQDPSDDISAWDYQEIEDSPRPVLALSEDAELIWRNFFNEIEQPQIAGGAYESIRAFAGRAGELARRVATVFAFFESKTEIDHIAMQGACNLVRYSLNEWLRYTEAVLVDNKSITAEKIERWLIQHCKVNNSDAMLLRDAYQRVSVKTARKKAPFIKAIAPLVETDRARIEKRGGVDYIALNPHVLT